MGGTGGRYCDVLYCAVLRGDVGCAGQLVVQYVGGLEVRDCKTQRRGAEELMYPWRTTSLLTPRLRDYSSSKHAACISYPAASGLTHAIYSPTPKFARGNKKDQKPEAAALRVQLLPSLIGPRNGITGTNRWLLPMPSPSCFISMRSLCPVVGRTGVHDPTFPKRQHV